MWQGRQYFESSHSSDSRDAEALLLKRKMELDFGRIASRPSEILTVDELLDSYISQIENPATDERAAVVDGDDDALATMGHPELGAERQRAVGRGHGVLVEALTGGGPAAGLVTVVRRLPRKAAAAR